jgi:hypothetical protein
MQMIKVFGLMTGLTLLLVFAGSYFGGTNGAVLFFVIAAAMNFGMYWFSDKAVLRMYKARVIAPEDAPSCTRWSTGCGSGPASPCRRRHRPSEQPNAFATGRTSVARGGVRHGGDPPARWIGASSRASSRTSWRTSSIGTCSSAPSRPPWPEPSPCSGASCAGG